MQNIVPIFYCLYGRYLTRYRAIPYYIDALKPIERRLLLSLYETAKDKYVKAAKVVGYTIGSYSPHGDISTFNSLVNLVHNGYAEKQGNWGGPGLDDSSSAAMRYVEIKSSDFISKIAFEYLKYVPRETLELDPEPLYLPCPVPLGLINDAGYFITSKSNRVLDSDGVITGVAFHKTVIPKYKFYDLLMRLIWILDNPDKDSRSKLVIKPDSDKCEIIEAEPGSYLSLLTTGIGKLKYVPKIDTKDGKNITLLGRSPLTSFTRLKKVVAKGLLNAELKDISGKTIEILVKPKRGSDLKEFILKLLSYIDKNINFNIIVCDEEGKIKQCGIDDILLLNYSFWKKTILTKFIDDYRKAINSKIFFNILEFVKGYINQHGISRIDDIITSFNELKKTQQFTIQYEEYNLEKKLWIKSIKDITEEDIRETCKKYITIEKLIETKSSSKEIEIEIANTKNNINNIDKICFDKLKTYLPKKEKSVKKDK